LPAESQPGLRERFGNGLPARKLSLQVIDRFRAQFRRYHTPSPNSRAGTISAPIGTDNLLASSITARPMEIVQPCPPKTTGDGFLVEFGSVVEALRCATEVQAHMAERNATAMTDRGMGRFGASGGEGPCPQHTVRS
jgi:hypothetical protein